VVPVGKMYEAVLCDAGDSDYDRLVVVAVSYYFYVPLLYPPAASILCTQHSARRTWYDQAQDLFQSAVWMCGGGKIGSPYELKVKRHAPVGILIK
jgi:hypothetical protein